MNKGVGVDNYLTSLQNLNNNYVIIDLNTYLFEIT
jgi:hypothetical protein